MNIVPRLLVLRAEALDVALRFPERRVVTPRASNKCIVMKLNLLCSYGVLIKSD